MSSSLADSAASLPSELRNDHSRYIVFTLGSERFALPLLTVREVIAPPEITPIPFSPNYFLGIMNLRGQVISVLDLRLKLQLKTEKNPENAIVIVDLGNLQLGMWVDSVDFVLTPTPEQTHQPPSGQGGSSARFKIDRVFRHQEGLILAVEPLGILSKEDQSFLGRSVGSASPEAA
jgi:purine-binding chemotaxis protein CheW